MRLVDPRTLPQLMSLEDHEPTMVEGTLGPRNATPAGEEGAPGHQHHTFPWVVTLLAGVLITTIVVDVIGNLLVIVSVFRNRKLRKAASSAPSSTSRAIAINRYCYICHSLKYDKLFSNSNTMCYVVLVWALTILAIVPNWFVESLQYDPRVYSCTFAQSVSSLYTITVVVVHFILPIGIVTYCYLRIWILVIQVRRRVKPDSRPKIKPHDLRNFLTMFVVFVLFAVCWAPLNLIGLAVALDSRLSRAIPEWLFTASYFMAYFNSCLNAVVYGVLNHNFRKEYKRIVLIIFKFHC
ncbi:hypothetical protein L3Q82_020260 [Scortum barcoo]|uniref:Uncharacterized protein n=1 Tax=Scortum barcoo TaxID=214431 RepID=A0ACB8V9I5_9TELE|nr:hypothetical protein L3Q82_020260 [Scortum barcoo]